MPLRRRDGGDDRRTFELVESAGIDVDPDLLDAPHPVLLGALPRDTPPGLGAHDATVAAGDGPDGVDVEGRPVIRTSRASRASRAGTAGERAGSPPPW